MRLFNFGNELSIFLSSVFFVVLYLRLGIDEGFIEERKLWEAIFNN